MSRRVQRVGTDREGRCTSRRWAVRECFYGAPSGRTLPKNHNGVWVAAFEGVARKRGAFRERTTLSLALQRGDMAARWNPASGRVFPGVRQTNPARGRVPAQEISLLNPRCFPSIRALVFFVAINFWAFGSTLVASAALTIATYNVENYLVADRMVEGVYRDAYPKPEHEKMALRQVIKTLAPDILALQEMGTQLYLDELLRDLKKDGVDYPHVNLLDGPDPDRHVAVLSKVPFKKITPHATVPVLVMGKKDNVKRGVLEVRFATSEGELTLFVIHLKSRRTEQKEDVEGVKRRQEEAEAVRDLILKRFPDPAKGRFILCGDWNDTRNSKPVLSLQKRGQTKLGEILRATDSRGEVWTHSYYKEDSYSRIDYFLLSADLQPLVLGGRGQVYDGPGVAEASDHRPVVVTLNLDVVR